MSKLLFTSNAQPTVGIELELALVDAASLELSSSILDVMKRLPSELEGHVKPELMQCYLEINTGVCRTIGEAEADLRPKLLAVQQIVDSLGLELYWTATHPFSRWQDQNVTPNERYELLVGVESGDKAVMVCDRVQRHLPTLLALSCNSPWWNNRRSGLLSHRSKVMESLPTAGLPPLMRNFSEYSWLVNHLVDTGFITSIRDIWWDVRPHNNFGTVEVRVCDMPGSLEDCLALAALTQCLVVALSEHIDEGTYQHDHHPMVVRQNKWRAARYGLDAALVDSDTFALCPARAVATQLIERLRPTARQLQCEAYLDRAAQLAGGPTWAEQQLTLAGEVGDPRELIRQMSRRARVTAA
jgi:carboxylate-amine ligase